MKFHHQGYVSGDPRIQPARGCGLDRPADLPEQVDVLIVGAGPAGMIAAAQLAQFPDITTRIVDRRAGREAIGPEHRMTIAVAHQRIAAPQRRPVIDGVEH